LWLYLATAEKKLGLPIGDEAIRQMEENLVSFSEEIFLTIIDYVLHLDVNA
jgi:hypothetical protein